MITAIASISIIICGIIAFFRPMIGILLLLVLECSFVIPANYVTLNLGVTGTGASTIIVLALLIKTLSSEKIHIIADFDARILVALMSWLAFSASVALLLGTSTKKDLLSVVFLTAIYYILPLTVMCLKPAERTRLANYTVLIAVVAAIIHLYVLKTKNANFIANHYYILGQPSNLLATIQETLRTGIGTYFVPRASALIMITTGFLSARLILRNYKNVLGLSLLICSLGVCLISSITFAQRSFIIVMPFLVLLYISISLKNRGMIATAFAMFIVLGSGYLVINTAASKTDFTHLMENRIKAASKSGSLDPAKARLAANIDALNYVIESPVWGVGSIVTGEKGLFGSKSQDAHSLVRMGLMGGIPAILLMMTWLASLFIRFCRLSLGYETSKAMCLSAFGAVLCGTLMMMVNTVPILIYSMNVIPFAIFVGLFISEYKPIKNESETTQ